MPLNEKQTRFAHAYIACGGNGRAAAIQAGYSPSSAAKRACDLLKVPEVQDIVQSHRDAVLKGTENFDVVDELIGLYRMSVASGSLAVAHNALDPPPLNWSTVYFSERRIKDGNETTQTRRDSLQVTAG